MQQPLQPAGVAGQRGIGEGPGQRRHDVGTSVSRQITPNPTRVATLLEASLAVAGKDFGKDNISAQNRRQVENGAG